jgi:hypothetical protein
MKMNTPWTNRGRWLGALVVVGLLGAAMGADDPRKTVKAGGLSFEVPQSWKSTPTASQMRLVQFKVDPVQGDDFAAELVVYAFPGGAGTVDMNVKRWQSQFRGPDGNPPKIETKDLKGKNTDVTRVETGGHYTPSRFPGLAPEPERDNARLLGGIVITERYGYFLKMVGPDKTMNSIKPAFDHLLSSIEVDAK